MKNGIEYFPLDVVLDDKFELLEAEFGLTGFGVVVKILSKIYGGQGYYVEWTNEVALLFAKKIGLGGNVVSEIVSASIKRGIFDERLFAEYGILTSSGIQKRYFEAVSRRKNVDVREEYLLGGYAQKFKNVNISGKNVNISPENADNSEQSKVEESKVEYSKVEESSVDDGGDDTERDRLNRIEGTLGKGVVYLTDRQFDDLVDRLGLAAFDRYMDRLATFIIESGAHIKNHYETILKWYEQDRKVKGS